jgi:hypothetical protein
VDASVRSWTANGIPVQTRPEHASAEGDANAALIASAPEQQAKIEALVGVLEELRAWVIQHPPSALWNDRDRDMLTRADAALRLAGKLP